MRISDWSSDVCSSDLNVDFRVGQPAIDRGFGVPPGAAAIIRATTTTNTFHARARLGSNRVMDTAKLVERVKSILLSPKSEWPVIAAEPATIKGLYTGYFMILAAIPAVFGFIKGSLIGPSLFGVTVTTSILSGLVAMVFSYVLSLVMLYVVALIINALAPTFGGRQAQMNARKSVGPGTSVYVSLDREDPRKIQK